jgi:hypothetical protein
MLIVRRWREIEVVAMALFECEAFGCDATAFDHYQAH